MNTSPLDTYLTHKRPTGCPHGFASVQLTLCPTCTPATPDQGKAGAAGANEWSVFVAAVRQVVRPDGTVRANDVRPLIRGRIFHKRIGGYYNRAVNEGLLERLGYEDSADTQGRNTHHGSGVFRLRGAGQVAA